MLCSVITCSAKFGRISRALARHRLSLAPLNSVHVRRLNFRAKTRFRRGAADTARPGVTGGRLLANVRESHGAAKPRSLPTRESLHTALTHARVTHAAGEWLRTVESAAESARVWAHVERAAADELARADGEWRLELQHAVDEARLRQSFIHGQGVHDVVAAILERRLGEDDDAALAEFVVEHVLPFASSYGATLTETLADRFFGERVVALDEEKRRELAVALAAALVAAERPDDALRVVRTAFGEDEDEDVRALHVRALAACAGEPREWDAAMELWERAERKMLSAVLHACDTLDAQNSPPEKQLLRLLRSWEQGAEGASPTVRAQVLLRALSYYAAVVQDASQAKATASDVGYFEASGEEAPSSDQALAHSRNLRLPFFKRLGWELYGRQRAVEAQDKIRAGKREALREATGPLLQALLAAVQQDAGELGDTPHALVEAANAFNQLADHCLLVSAMPGLAHVSHERVPEMLVRASAGTRKVVSRALDAVAQAADSATVSDLVALQHLKGGNLQQAERTAHSKHVRSQAWLAEARQSFAQGEHERAIALLERVCKASRGSVHELEATCDLANIYISQQQAKQAEALSLQGGRLALRLLDQEHEKGVGAGNSASLHHALRLACNMESAMQRWERALPYATKAASVSQARLREHVQAHPHTHLLHPASAELRETLIPNYLGDCEALVRCLAHEKRFREATAVHTHLAEDLLLAKNPAVALLVQMSLPPERYEHMLGLVAQGAGHDALWSREVAARIAAVRRFVRGEPN